MKKIFTLFFALLAFAFCAKAQVPVFSENFDAGMPTGWTQIDANNDNYGWEHSSAPVSYHSSGVDLSGNGHNSSTGFVLSGSYSNATSTAITPDNWLITPAITLTANSDLSFWVNAQDANYAAEHYGVYITTGAGTATTDFTLLFEETIDANGGSRAQGAWKQKTYSLSSYTGQTVRIAFRHFNCYDQFILNLDDVEILAQPTDPTIVANPNSVNFGSVAIGNNVDATVNVVTYNLTAAVSATTTAPFEISADGTTFGTTATIPAAGGALTVRYTPVAAGAANGTITLSSTGATNVTVALTGDGVDCSGATIPYSCDFTNDAQLFCWDIDDANNDGYTFEFDGGYATYSYNSSSAADDWLISPTFTLTGNQIATIDYSAQSASYPERFQVFAINGTQNTPLTGQIDVANTADQTLTIDLTSLNGNYRIGFHCISDADEWNLYLTNFTVSDISGSDLSANPDALDFAAIEINQTTAAQEVVIYSLNISEPINLAVSAPFQVSVDGNTFGNTATIPANSNMVVYTTVYVRFAPTTVGTFNQNLTASAAGLQTTVALVGQSADCSTGISNFPYLNDFNTGVYPPICWTADNDENYTRVANDEDGIDYGLAFLDVDKIVTPEIHANQPFVVGFDYACYLGSEYDVSTTFRVGYSTSNTSNFTWSSPLVSDVQEYAPFGMTVPAETKYIAIEVVDMESYLYYGILEYPNYFFVDNFTLSTEGVGVETFEENTVSVYPNPAKNVLNINASSNINRVEVYNMMGQMIGSYTANDMNTQINTTNYANGIYTVKISTENGTTTSKFTVAR